jgi:hypothetical protein
MKREPGIKRETKSCFIIITQYPAHRKESRKTF